MLRSKNLGLIALALGLAACGTPSHLSEPQSGAATNSGGAAPVARAIPVVMHREGGVPLSWVTPDASSEQAFALANNFEPTGLKNARDVGFRTGGKVAVARFGQMPMGTAFEDLANHYGVGSDQTVDIAVMIDRTYLEPIAKAKVYEGIREGLARMQNKNVRLAVVTYGKRTKEKVVLDFTTSVLAAQNKVADLAVDTSNFSDDHNGSALLHSVETALGSLTWTAPRRTVFVVSNYMIAEMNSDNLPDYVATRDRVLGSLVDKGISINTLYYPRQ